MKKFQISEAAYEFLRQKAIEVAEVSTDDYSFNRAKTYDYHNDFPTIEELEEHDIGSDMDEYRLLYLIYYGEEKCIDEEADEWVPIYTPPAGKEKEYAEVRRYIQRLIRQHVDIR